MACIRFPPILPPNTPGTVALAPSPKNGLGNDNDGLLLGHPIVQCHWNWRHHLLGTKVLLCDNQDRNSCRCTHHQHRVQHHAHLHHRQRCSAGFRASAHQLRRDTHLQGHVRARRNLADHRRVSSSKPRPCRRVLTAGLYTQHTRRPSSTCPPPTPSRETTNSAPSASKMPNRPTPSQRTCNPTSALAMPHGTSPRSTTRLMISGGAGHTKGQPTTHGLST